MDDNKVGNLVIQMRPGDKFKIGESCISYIERASADSHTIKIGIQAPKSIKIQRMKDGVLIDKKET